MESGASSTSKKLPFKRRTTRKVEASGGEEDSLNLFKRSTQMIPKFVAEADERVKRAEMLKEKHKRERDAMEKRAREDDCSDEDGALEEMPKKRQTTESKSPSSSFRSPGSSHAISSPSRLDSQNSSLNNSQNPSQSQKEIAPPPLSLPNISEVVELDSDSDSNPNPDNADDDGSPLAVIDDVEDDVQPVPVDQVSDPELQKYIEEARKARLRREQLEQQQQERAQNPGNSTSDLPTTTPSRPIRGQSITTVIISHIPGTSEFPGFHIPVEKPLEELKQSWIEQQALRGTPVPDEHDVVLTWRGNEIYSTTTLQSLNIGIGTGSGGTLRVHLRGDSKNNSGFSADGRKAIFEAWTHTLLQQDRERKARMALHDSDDDGDAGADDREGLSAYSSGAAGNYTSAATATSQSVDEEDTSQTKIRLTLQAKDGQTAKLSATPETQISMLVQAFMRKNDVPAGMRVEIRFDGLALDNDSTLEDAEVEDRDTMEVHFVAG
ncbi:Ubiquitin-2 like Rad60 SUMO-like protein [Ceratocystis lukuohia]|uniref:Ubiquitin-2 like Rad60 SUMO-like protein n=1 Tax=Ceratocystis lukuohia TaxID=2019550 RepID=A0ABR4MCG0_9PEZI